MGEQVTIIQNELVTTITDNTPASVTISEPGKDTVSISGSGTVTISSNQPTEVVVHNGVGNGYDLSTIEGLLLGKVTSAFLNPALTTDINNIRDLWTRLGMETVLLLADKTEITTAYQGYTDGKFTTALQSVTAVDDRVTNAFTEIDVERGRINSTVGRLESTNPTDPNLPGSIALAMSRITQTETDINSNVIRLNAIDDPLTGVLAAHQSSINQQAVAISLRLKTTDLATQQVITDMGTDMSTIESTISSWVTGLSNLEGEFQSARNELTETTASTEILTVNHGRRLSAVETMLANKWGVSIAETVGGQKYVTGIGLFLHPDWALNNSYAVDEYVFYFDGSIGQAYRCILDHTSSSSNSPGSIDWSTYWEMTEGSKSSVVIQADELKIITPDETIKPLLTLNENNLSLHTDISVEGNAVVNGSLTAEKMHTDFLSVVNSKNKVFTATENSPIVWTDLVGVVDNSTEIIKTASDGWGNAGAASTKVITSNGWIEFKITNGTGNPPDTSTTQDGYGNEIPVALFVVDKYIGLPGETINFDASSAFDLDGGIIQYQWDFDDGFVGSGSTVSHTFTSSGTFNVTLLVVDNMGAIDTYIKPITIHPDIPSLATDLPVAVGLSASNDDANPTTIDYCIKAALGLPAVIQENGVYRAYGTIVDMDTVFRVERVGYTVHYKQNGVIIHTSTVPATADLIADIALHNFNGAVLSPIIDISTPLPPEPPYVVGDLWNVLEGFKRCVSSRETGAFDANDWSNVIVDSTKEALQIGTTITSGGITVNGSTGDMEFNGTTGELKVSGNDGGAATDYALLSNGTLGFYYWNGVNHSLYNPVSRVVSASGVPNNTIVQIPGYFREPPKITLWPEEISTYDPTYSGNKQTIQVKAENLSLYNTNQWQFNAIARTVLSEGIGSYVVVGNVNYDVNMMVWPEHSYYEDEPQHGLNGCNWGVRLQSGGTWSPFWDTSEVTTQIPPLARSITLYGNLRGQAMTYIGYIDTEYLFVATGYRFRRTYWRLRLFVKTTGAYFDTGVYADVAIKNGEKLNYTLTYSGATEDITGAYVQGDVVSAHTSWIEDATLLDFGNNIDTFRPFIEVTSFGTELTGATLINEGFLGYTAVGR